MSLRDQRCGCWFTLFYTLWKWVFYIINRLSNCVFYFNGYLMIENISTSCVTLNFVTDWLYLSFWKAPIKFLFNMEIAKVTTVLTLQKIVLLSFAKNLIASYTQLHKVQILWAHINVCLHNINHLLLLSASKTSFSTLRTSSFS